MSKRTSMSQSSHEANRPPGPIVVSKRDASSLKGITVAVPGTLTTAFLALRLFDPSVQYVVMPFDEIQEAVRHAAEDLPASERGDDFDKLPVFDRAEAEPKV